MFECLDFLEHGTRIAVLPGLFQLDLGRYPHVDFTWIIWTVRIYLPWPGRDEK